MRGQRESFEKLCCQLARLSSEHSGVFFRLHGAGGDGGIECYLDLPSGKRTCWQAKYIFEIGPLLTQATRSFKAALETQPTLSTFILCFPFDLTGVTGRRCQSGIQKFEAWRQTQSQKAQVQGRSITIEIWPASKLMSLMLEYDVSCGLRRYFFDSQVLSHDWFADHFESVRNSAGPRYTPDLNIKTDVSRWFSAFGQTAEWQRQFAREVLALQKVLRTVQIAIGSMDNKDVSPGWPDTLESQGQICLDLIKRAIDICESLKMQTSLEAYKNGVESLEKALSELYTLDNKIEEAFDLTHDKGRANSVRFLQFTGEHPAANLDRLRKLIDRGRHFFKWLSSDEVKLAFTRAFVLTGDWGVGKTHTVCDVVKIRLESTLYSCVVFGHQFGGEPNPWTRMAEALGLSKITSRDELLDALDAAGATSGYPVIFFIDAINETKPLSYWKNQLNDLIQQVTKRANLRICLTCRTPYLSEFLLEKHKPLTLKHPGFKGCEQVACAAFFKNYKLHAPISPILPPEMSNPLYLRLVCETMQSTGLLTVPTGWSSSAQVIKAFLREKEKEFAQDKGISAGIRIVSKSLQCIAQETARSEQVYLTWSQALQVIEERVPEIPAVDILSWLVKTNLLIEDSPNKSTSFLLDEDCLRFSFERFGDFLMAFTIIETRNKGFSLKAGFDPGGALHRLVKDEGAIANNHGLLSALSIILPEMDRECELSYFVENSQLKNRLDEVVLISLPWRDTATYSSVTHDLLKRCFSADDLCDVAFDSLLTCSWKPSVIDAFYLHKLLVGRPRAERNVYWCGYLQISYEVDGPIRSLINTCMSLDHTSLLPATAERWVTVLLWATAATDRRVKDEATRSAVHVLTMCPQVAPSLFDRFIELDDDEVRERLFLSIYGALIVNRSEAVLRIVVDKLHESFVDNAEAFCNAHIRDLIRALFELAIKLNCLPAAIDPLLATKPIFNDLRLENPSRSKWETEPVIEPYLLEERKLDPTLPHIPPMDIRSEPKWINAEPNFDTQSTLTDAGWTEAAGNVPDLQQLLFVTKDRRDWRLLAAHLSWPDRSAWPDRSDAEDDETDRAVSIEIQSYLVKKTDIEKAYSALKNPNSFRQLTAAGSNLICGFVGEYPWATTYNLYGNAWHEIEGVQDIIPFYYQPAWNNIFSGWPYDRYGGSMRATRVPAPEFFQSNDLWFNGRDGFQTTDRTTVFVDPSINTDREPSLFAESLFLSKKLDELCFVLDPYRCEKYRRNARETDPDEDI